MDLLVGLFIGTIYGRNAREVNQKTCDDIQKTWKAFCKTKFAFNLYYLADTLCERAAGLHKREVIFNHDMLCTCNRRNCMGYTPSIATYARKIKATA